jgi:acetoacetyl-CoA reductase
MLGEARIVIAGCHPTELASVETWQAQFDTERQPVHVVAADVADYDACQQMVNNILSEHGSLDILINCAGITRDSTLKKMQPEQWTDVVNTNLNSVYNVTQPVVAGMSERGFGRIVNIASVNGQRGQFGQTNYAATKAGVHGFTMSLAQETALKGITVNTVAPGYVDTKMTRAVREDIRQDIIGSIPLGRMAMPDEIAHAVSFLTDERSAYITGIVLPVNGGMYMSF